jgi:peroxiredoxin
MKARLFVLTTTLLTLAAFAAEPLKTGEAAPEFTLKDTEGNEHSLSDFKGKIVVLEWTNYGCPFVKKHYGGGNMQMLQEKYTGKGVVWLSICSSAPGKQGYYTAEQWPEQLAAAKAKATALLPDADGTVGKLYGAKTTPHMFVIDKQGRLAYQGAIDDNRSWDPKTIEGAKNYVAAALDALLADEAVAEPETKPYGCSVKY